MSKQENPANLFQIVIFAIVLYAVLDAIAQVLPPHYDPISQAESDLAVGKFGFIMTINFINRGLLSLIFIAAFIRELSLVGIQRAKFRVGLFLIGIWALGALLLAIFPSDVPATPISWHGAIHLVVAIIAFISGAFGTVAISRNLDYIGSLKKFSLVISVICVILWAVEFGLPFVTPRLNGQIGGLTERLFLGSVLFWIGAVSCYFASGKAMKKLIS